MKTILIILLAGIFTQSVLANKLRFNANDIVRIEISDDKDHSGKDTVQALRRRVRLLERAVRQLQEQVYDLKYAATPGADEKQITCFITTPFNGTLSGTGSTLVEAKAKALQACEAAGAGFHCKPEKLTCD